MCSYLSVPQTPFLVTMMALQRGLHSVWEYKCNFFQSLYISLLENRSINGSLCRAYNLRDT